jgi:hypothetical protein
MPNEDSLGEIIKNELIKEFGNADGNNVYSKYLEAMLDWMKAKEGKFFTHEEGKALFETLKEEIPETISFNVKAPEMLFTGREYELERLHKKVQRSPKDAVVLQLTSISGLGGIGKSELARMYANDYGQQYYDNNIIWINAESPSTMEMSFQDLASDKRLGIPTKDIKDIKIHCKGNIYDFRKKEKHFYL